MGNHSIGAIIALLGMALIWWSLDSWGVFKPKPAAEA